MSTGDNTLSMPWRLLAAAVALLISIVALSAAQAGAASVHDGPTTRAALASQRKLDKASVCHRRRGRAHTARQRRREKRRLRRCRRHQPTKKADKALSSVAPSPVLWGAWIGDQLTGTQAPWDMKAVSSFEAMTNKPLSLVQFSSPFANCASSRCSFYSFPSGPMESIRKHGSIPFFSWASQSTPSSLNEPAFQLSDVIAGNYDSYIREFAEGARKWGHPFFLRFNWEMNGNWFPWSEGVNGNQPGEFVAAWRHVHDIFTEVGATNATWVWCPNVDPEHKLQNLASLYPGNEYVDWTGLDGYNWGTNPTRPDRWRTFDQLYSSTYKQITETIAPGKPLVVSEVGSTEDGGSKATWIEEMLSEVPTAYPDIRGLLWFENYEDGMDWPIETSPSAAGAFATGIQNPAYVGNEFASLGGGPVQPPS